ncbi:MAG: glycosyltransferase [Thermoplasmatota archaeon]
MRILHVNGPAGVAARLARAQKAQGHEVDTLGLYGGNPFAYEWTIDLHGASRVRTWSDLARMPKKYDVLHLHDCFPLPLHLLRKWWSFPVVFHHHGTITREGRAWWGKIPVPQFVSTADLIPHVTGAEHLPAPFFGGKSWSYGGSVPVVSHLPTHPTRKGTVAFKSALESSGIPHKFLCLGGLTNAQSRAIFEASDLVLDQWAPDVGSFGITTLEAVERGVPSVASAHREAGFPVLSDLTQGIAKLLGDSKARQSLWHDEHRYLDEVHRPERIARKTLRAYGVAEAPAEYVRAPEATLPILGKAIP